MRLESWRPGSRILSRQRPLLSFPTCSATILLIVTFEAVLAPPYRVQPCFPSRACQTAGPSRWLDGLDAGDPDTGSCIGGKQCLSKNFNQNGSQNLETRCGRCSTGATSHP